jgi:hypothetical protein
MTRFRRLIPSPAMAVALTALFLSLGGVSYGLATGAIDGREIRNNTITFKDVRKDKLGGGSIKESTLGTVGSSFVAHGSVRYAVVNAGGQLIRGRNASAARTGDGRYQVLFETNMRGCGYYATIGGPTAAAPPENGQITVSGLGANVNGVDIRTTGANGNDANKPFHLLVLC